MFCFGCYSGDINMVNILFKYVNKVVINKSDVCLSYRVINIDYNLLVIVCDFGNLSIIMVLLVVGVDVNLGIENRYEIFLIGVCKKGFVDIVRELIKVGVDVN